MMNSRQKEAEKNALNEMDYRRAANNMAKCEKNLQTCIKANEEAAIRDEREGRHANAITHARTVRSLSGLREKMLQMQSNLEMVHTMRGIGAAFETFTGICNSMMKGMDLTGNPEAIARSAAAMERAEYEMEAMMNSINDSDLTGVADTDDEESEEYLRSLMKEKQHKSASRLTALTEKAFSGGQKD